MSESKGEGRLHETGWYRDRGGRSWHCVSTETSMVCNSVDGYFTSAYHRTFRAWGWEKIDLKPRAVGDRP